jgi:hypothetical protein
LEFERKRKEVEETAEAKTAKNRAKRQKKKERAKQTRGKSEETNRGNEAPENIEAVGLPLKRRRLVNGKELVFRRPGEGESGDESDGVPPPYEPMKEREPQDVSERPTPLPVAEELKITIHEDN